MCYAGATVQLGVPTITAVTLGELSHGANATSDPVKRARRIGALQHAEAAFGDRLPYDAEAGRLYGLICAALRAIGRQPLGRTANLMIAATAARNNLPLFTTNPKDFLGLDEIVTVVPVTHPEDATS